MNRLCLSLAALVLVVARPAPAQIVPEKALETFSVVEPLELKLWASEPLFTNPTCFDVDHLGRVWVCESVNYRSKLRNQPLKRAEGDRILVLEDTDHDGTAEKVTVFYQAPEVLAPLGIAVAPEPDGKGVQVYVCQSPDILLFEDKDGDGKADGPPKKLLTGFKGYDHDHGVHGILIGPDGKLYFTVGDQGVDGLKDKNGKVWRSNSTDCRAGTVWRCDLDGSNLELLAHNFRNNYEPAVDSFGTVFLSDNDDDGNQQTRICYVMPGGNYGYHPRGPGQSHWHEEQPGVVPKILRTYFGSPTGLCVYEGTLLPEKYRGQLLHTDAGPRQVRCYHLTPDGAGFAVEREDMVNSTDNWFRPSDVCVAPDGSVFVADWYDPGVGGHGMGDITRGRIYRLATKGAKPAVPAIDLQDKDGITRALASPNLAVRHMAMSRLASMDRKEAVDILEVAALPKADPVLRARALWQLGRLGRLRLVTTAFTDPDPNFRLLAVRILKDMQGQSPADYVPDWQQAYLKDPSAAVRREALLALRDVDPAAARRPIIELAKRHDGKDIFYLCAIGIAVGTDPARRDAILKDFDKEFPQWNDQTASLVWELRPPAILPRLEQRLTDAKLPAAQRAQILDILASSDNAAAGLVLIKVLRTDLPAEVRDRAVANLAQFLPGKWQELRKGPDLDETIRQLLKQPATETTALELIAAGEKTDYVSRVSALAGIEEENAATRNAAIRCLGQLPAAEAVKALEALLPVKPPFRTEVVAALGKHAGLPKSPTATPALKILQTLLLSDKQEFADRTAALTALAGTRAGTQWLLDIHDKNELPAALVADAGRFLRNTPYQDLRNKALIAFPAPGKLDPKRLPSVASLLTRTGNVDRGRQVLARSLGTDLACMKCHTVRGVGGQIGPDLSMIGKKASRQDMFTSVLEPSKAVADQYVTWQIETRQGLLIGGLLVEETPDSLMLRDANGKDYKIAKKDVETRTKDPKSLMPDNLLAFLSEDELIDLVDYLMTLKTPVLAPDVWHIAGPFPGTLDQEFGPDKGIDLQANYGPVKWRTVKPDAKGYVDLQAFHAPANTNIVSFLYAEIESPADQDGRILLGTDDGAKLWVNGELLITTTAGRAAVPEQDSAPVKLKKGRNTLLLKIANGNGPHGFYLSVQAEQELKRAAVR